MIDSADDGGDRGALARRLRGLGIRPSKRLGQNFLVCDEVIAAMVESAAELRPEVILEIGPGLGALTQRLADVASRVVAVEIDGRLAEALATSVAEDDRIQVVRGDIRDVRVAAFADGRDAVVVGSIPYRISADILRWLVRERANTRGAVLLTQREVAEKILSSPGRDGSALGIFVQAYAMPQAGRRVPRGCFYPVPEVDSQVWSLHWRPAPAFSVSEDRFFALVRALYGSRRKMARSALRTLLGGRCAQILAAAGVEPERRGEAMTMAELDAIARAWEDLARSGNVSS